jgi:hypothetical protein
VHVLGERESPNRAIVPEKTGVCLLLYEGNAVVALAQVPRRKGAGKRTIRNQHLCRKSESAGRSEGTD